MLPADSGASAPALTAAGGPPPPQAPLRADLAPRRRGAAPPPSIAIRLTNVHKTYLMGLEGVPALRGVDVSIRRGEFVVVLGKSGGGKTSLLK